MSDIKICEACKEFDIYFSDENIEALPDGRKSKCKENCTHWLCSGSCNHLRTWIDINTLMPEPYTPVLVCDVDGISADERQPETAHIDDDGLFYYMCPWNYRLFHRAKVTHWMPLPEPKEKI